MKQACLLLAAAVLLAASGGCCAVDRLGSHAWGCGVGHGCKGDSCGYAAGGGCDSCGQSCPRCGHGLLKGICNHCGAAHASTTMGGEPTGPYAGNGTVAYPYYTTRGPRDFLAKNPGGIGP
ncbi:MAG: hypothetical protein SFX18_16535 [Pirellulales bacterium]|nr:hypothetical protein [Pirellulales bacterium]